MIAWLVWFFVAPHLFWLERWLVDVFGVPVQFGLAVCFVLALFVRTSALPGLLFGAAAASSLLGDGPIALHFLAFGLPVAVLIPLRTVFFRGAILWQGAAAAFLALAVPRVGQFFARLIGVTADSIVMPSGVGVMFAMLLVPGLAWVLRKTPPLRAFQEVST